MRCITITRRNGEPLKRKGEAGETRKRAKETRVLLRLLAQPQAINRASQSLMLFLGGIFYIGLLLINAVAVLSEDRFLARSACLFAVPHPSHL